MVLWSAMSEFDVYRKSESFDIDGLALVAEEAMDQGENGQLAMGILELVRIQLNREPTP